VPRSEQSTPASKKSGPEHFSPLADKQTPKEQIPECVKCGKPSFGGMVTHMGDNFIDLTFLCKECAGEDRWSFAVASLALFPHYEIIAFQGPGKLRVRKLERDEAMKRVKGR
jgi:hypothetical protein